MPITTKTPSLNDKHLDKQTSEITTAARVFSLLGYESVEFITVGANGKRLERPDLDARLPDGAYIGVEVADVSETSVRKHDSATALFRNWPPIPEIHFSPRRIRKNPILEGLEHRHAGLVKS